MDVEEGVFLKVEATEQVIANFALQHLKAATTFESEVARLEAKHDCAEFGPFFEDIRSYASACLMSSAASLEALINELFIAHHSPLRAQLKDFDKEFWGKGGIEWKPILKKYQIALEMLGAEPLDKDNAPYRDAWALIELRNALVHYKPTWDPQRERTVALVDILDGRFTTSRFVDDGADFVSMKCMSADCATWAVNSVLAIIRELECRTDIEPSKLSRFLRLRGD